MNDKRRDKIKGRKILVVEDEYLLAQELADAVWANGADIVGPAATIGDAMDLVRRSRGIDLAILDIDVNGMSILPVARELQKRGVPFVFATALHRSIVPREFQDVPCWQKPIDPDDVVRSLSSLCETAAT